MALREYSSEQGIVGVHAVPNLFLRLGLYVEITDFILKSGDVVLLKEGETIARVRTDDRNDNQ